MKYKKLKDIIEFNPQEKINKKKKYKKIKMENIKCFNKNISQYSIEEYNGGMKFRNGDTLLARITPCLENGKTAQVDILEENEIGYGSSEYIVMRPKDGISDKDYIYYLSISPFFRDVAIKSMVGTSGRQRVQLDVLKNLEMLIPDYEIQVKIGKILSKFDEKININNKTNDNLYKILEQYIDEHYYNNEFVQNGNVSDIGKIQGGYAFKSKDLLDKTTNNKILKIKNIDVSGVDIDNTQYVYDEVADKVDKKFLIIRGNVIIAMTGAELGKTGYLYGRDYRYLLNQRVGVITGTDKYTR